MSKKEDDSIKVGRRGALSARDIPIDKITISRLSALLNNAMRFNDCLLYVNPHHTGYALVNIGGVKYPAHRVVKAIAGGKNFPGLVIDHTCKNKSCIQVKHLEVVTQGENIKRGTAWLSLPNIGKTHCIRGHSLDEAYTRVRSSGSIKRQCRKCHTIRERNRRRRIKDAQEIR